MRKLIDDERKKGEWKIQLIMKINFISSKNLNDTRDMHCISDNIEIMMGFDTNEIILKKFNSLFQRYQKGLEVSMKGSDFVFDYVESLNYIFHIIDLKRSGSHIENDDDRCFQYSIINALNYDDIGKNHERVNNMKKYVDQYDWTGINFPSGVDDFRKFELNNKSVALNVLYVPYGEKTIRHMYKSKYNIKRKNQVILLRITDGEKFH